MREKDPIDKLFDEIADLTKMVSENQIDPKAELPSDINEKLTTLEQIASVLININDQALKYSGVTKERIQETLKNIHELPAHDRKILERGEKLKSEVEEIKGKIAANIIKAVKKEKKGKRPGIARKKKFRAVGGKKDWKPL
jgi:hypothetical protein